MLENTSDFFKMPLLWHGVIVYLKIFPVVNIQLKESRCKFYLELTLGLYNNLVVFCSLNVTLHVVVLMFKKVDSLFGDYIDEHNTNYKISEYFILLLSMFFLNVWRRKHNRPISHSWLDSGVILFPTFFYRSYFPLCWEKSYFPLRWEKGSLFASCFFPLRWEKLFTFS